MKGIKKLSSNKSTITVQEVHEFVPLADVHRLNNIDTYLIIVNKPKIQIIGAESPVKQAEKLMAKLNEHNIKALFVALDDKDEIKIIEMKRVLKNA